MTQNEKISGKVSRKIKRDLSSCKSIGISGVLYEDYVLDEDKDLDCNDSSFEDASSEVSILESMTHNSDVDEEEDHPDL